MERIGSMVYVVYRLTNPKNREEVYIGRHKQKSTTELESSYRGSGADLPDDSDDWDDEVLHVFSTESEAEAKEKFEIMVHLGLKLKLYNIQHNPNHPSRKKT